MSKKIKLIGVWNDKDNPDYPDPAAFVDFKWDDIVRDKVIKYLENIRPYVVCSSLTWCRFRCKSRIEIGYCNDGVFTWPLSLLHYVQHHGVRLPELFIEHVLRNENNIVGPELYDEILKKEIDCEWWKHEKGWSEGKSFLTSGLGGEIWVNSMPNKITADILKFFRKFIEFSMMSTKELRDCLYIKNNKFLLAKPYDYCDYIELNIIAQKLGIALEFMEKE